MNYISAKEARTLLHINATTLKKWKDTGLLKYKKLSSKKILYDIDSISTENKILDKQNVIYARVSNTKQYDDL